MIYRLLRMGQCLGGSVLAGNRRGQGSSTHQALSSRSAAGRKEAGLLSIFLSPCKLTQGLEHSSLNSQSLGLWLLGAPLKVCRQRTTL
jgi:hypothetical protein